VGRPVTALLHAELRKAFSTRLWWALGIPVLVLSVLYNLFGALLADLDGAGEDDRGTLVPLLSLAYTMVLTSVFGAVAGIVGAAGEFHHHTAATTYLLAPSRGRVLLAKLILGGLVGALYALAAALVGLPAALLGVGALPNVGLLLGLVGLGMAVGALWAAICTAVGTAIGNQVGALVATLIYLLFVDRMFSWLLSSSDTAAIAALSAYLPGKAADIVIYDFLVRGLARPGIGPRLVEEFASVSDPPPWWAALLVLAGWTAAAGALGWLLNGRRDIT
jgi:ABC-type transport system involved in multi-copper enzyme maturation permease subunit